MKNKIRRYTNSNNGSNIFSQFSKMFSELCSSRELLYRFIHRDITVRYRQSLFGYIWAVLPQIATVSLFSYLSRQRVFEMSDTQLPYVIHALWSISIWQLFSSSLIGCTNSLVNSGTLVTKINFPKETLVISAVGQPLIDFFIRLLPVTIVFIWYGFVPSWEVLFTPIIIFLILLMAVGLGFLLSILNLVLRDIGNAVSILLTFGVFLSPILYPPPSHTPFSYINTLNPFSPFLIATQELLNGSALSNSTALGVVSILSLFIFSFGWHVFRITIPRVTERA